MQVFEKIKYNLMVLAEETYYKSVDGDTNAGQRNSAYHKAIQIVEKVAEEYNNGWIPCEVELPNDKKGTQEVLVQRKNGERLVAFYNKGWSDGWIGLYDIEAWQPLPPKYKSKGE